MIIRPELTEKNSDIIIELTNQLYGKYKFSAQQITNLVLAIVIDNTPPEQLKQAVILTAKTAVKKCLQNGDLKTHTNAF